MTLAKKKIVGRGLWLLIGGGLATLGVTTGAASWGPTEEVGYVESSVVTDLTSVTHSYADLVDTVTPAVVRVRTSSVQESPSRMFNFEQPFRNPFSGDSRNPFDELPRAPENYRRQGVGSGVVVSPDGYIVTNHHVIEGSDTVVVRLTDHREFTAKVVGSDAATDLAVLKVDATDLPALALGDSDAARVGDIVLAIGEPLGLGQSVTMGIISAKGRTTGVGDGSYQNFLQIDAPINQGNSGGALVNMRSELVGINAQIVSPNGGNIGIGFAIPSNMVRHVMDQLVAFGEVRRGRLGVTIQDVTADLARSLELSAVRGVIVSAVEDGSPASTAGFHQGDVIVSFDDSRIEDGNQLRNLVARTAPGAEVPIRVLRDGRERTMHVTVAAVDRARVDADGDPIAEPALGMTAEPLSPERASQLGVEDTDGLLITAVDPSGEAANKGIRRGDVIVQVDGHAVTTRQGLRSALDQARDRPALVLLKRGGQSLYVALERPRG